MIEAVFGRLGAMKSGLLSKENFDALLHAGSVEEAVEALRSTTYASALGRLDQPTPVEIERAMWGEVIAAWRRLTKFLDGAPLGCARMIAGAFEVANVRLTVRRILAALPPGEGVSLWDLGRQATVDVSALRAARTVEDVAGLLKKTPFRSVFERAVGRSGLTEGREWTADVLAEFEQALDVNYRRALLETAAEVGGATRAYVRRRELYDDVRWALRLRFARGLSAEETKSRLAAADAAPRVLERVLAAASLEDAAGEVAPLIGGEAREKTLPALDRALRLARARAARRALGANFFDFASIPAYFDVRAQEVRDVMAALTARALGRTPEDAARYLAAA